MKKIIATIMLVALVCLVGCTAQTKVAQKTKQIEVGKEYTVNDLFEAKDEITSFSFANGDTLVADSIGEHEVTLKVDGKDEESKYVFNAVDVDGPSITQTKYTIDTGSLFNVNNFIKVEDNVDSKENITISYNKPDINTSKAGKYTVNVFASDKSLNTTNAKLEIEVTEPYVKVQPGDVIDTTGESTEMTWNLLSVGYQDTVETYSDNMFASYYPDQDDETYIVFKVKIKNLDSDNIGYSSTDKNKIVYDDKYTYNLYQLDTTSSVCSQYWTLKPLDSQEVFYYQSIPDEIKDKTFKAYFEINGTTYLYTNAVENTEEEPQEPQNQTEIVGEKVETGNKVTENKVTENKVTENKVTENNSNQEAAVKGDVILKVGDEIDTTGESTEMTWKLLSVGFQDTVETYSENMFASYYPDQDDETYIVFKVKIKNLDGEAIGYSSTDKNKIVFDNKYTYNLYQLDTTSSVCSEYWSLKPLNSQEVFYYQSIPDEIKNKPFKATFTINKTTYVYEHNV